MADRKNGTCLMAFDCFLYRKEKVYRGNVIYWKCVEYYGTSKCRGRLHSLGRQVVRTTKYHNHQPDAALMVGKPGTPKPAERSPDCRAAGRDAPGPAPHQRTMARDEGTDRQTADDAARDVLFQQIPTDGSATGNRSLNN